MAGRTPKPTALKLLQGNPGHRPLNKREPKPKPGSAPCPRWLSAEAQVAWKRLRRVLEDMGVLTVADHGAMVLYCQAWALFRQAVETVDTEGITIEMPNGRIARHPGCTIIRETTDTMHKIGVQFGLTPASRTRLMTNKPVDDTDDIAEFLNIGRGGK